MLSACHPGRCVFLTGPISLSPSRSGRVTGRLQGIWIPHDNTTKFSWWGGQRFCRKHFLAQEFASKAQWVATATSRAGAFPGSVRIHAFVYVGVCHLCQKTFTAQPYNTFVLGGDQILRRCMHTFECQLDPADRFGDVCRQSIVWLLKQTQSHVTHCHPYQHKVGKCSVLRFNLCLLYRK